MSPDTAARVAAHARRLLTAHIITPHDYAVLDAMLWRLRRPGRADIAVDYRTIARLAGVCRATTINSVRKFVEIGLLTKQLRRVRVAWGRGQTASRQIANAYVFRAPATESPRPAAVIGVSRKSPLERALESLASTFGVPLPVASG
jgi:hypothetical protein